MSKPIIAVDIDEVLFPYVQEFVIHHNEKYATGLLPEHFTSYEFEKVLGTSIDKAMEQIYEFTGLDHGLAKPVLDAQDGVKRLKERFDIYLLTARDPRFRPTTEAWLERHFPNTFSQLIMVGHEQDPSLKARTKAEVCKQIGAGFLVDDSSKYITQAAEAGVPGVLFGDYSWNQMDKLPKGVVRVNGWRELAEHFDV